jgi:hypothetical protein
MRGRLLAIALALCPFVAGAADLGSPLGASLRFAGNAGDARVAYCQGDSCELFSLRGRNARAMLEGFAAAYFYGVSEFTDLRHFQSEEPPEFVTRALAMYRPICPQTWARAAAQCVAAYLATSLHIRGRFVRWQGGSRIVIPFIPALTIGRARHDT